LGLKLLLKRGGLLAAANWPVIAIQFAAQTTFQVLLAVPIVGAAILVAVLLGADFGNLLQGTLLDTFKAIASALIAEPVALVAFMAAFAIVLVGGSVLMFLVKGGTIAVMLASDESAAPVEREPITLMTIRESSHFSTSAFAEGCQRLFSRYLALGALLMLAYAGSALAYLGFIASLYRSEGEAVQVFGWLMAAVVTVVLVLWITCVNLIYLLVQIVSAADDIGLAPAFRGVVRFVRAEFFELGGVFLVMCGLVLAVMLASLLAWSGVALIAFVPLVGLAIVPLNILALLVRGFVNEYIGLTAMGAYVSLYRRHRAASAVTSGQVAAAERAPRPASAG
jgi:hypothetical protein